MSEKPSKLLVYLPTAVILLLVFYVRVRLLAVPLERDEGEFAYIGQLLLKGVTPFTHAYTMKLPGVSAVYAMFMSVFGQTPSAIHLGLLVVNAVSILLIYLLARRLFDRDAAAISAAAYALLSLSRSVCGVQAHATHFVMLFALAGLLLLLLAIEKRRLALVFAGGLCFGLSFTMKQHAALLVVFAILYLVWRGWSRLEDRKFFLPAVALFVSATAIPYLLILAGMAKAGSFDRFWFWTMQYPREYVSMQTVGNGLDAFGYYFSGLLLLQFPFWLLAGAGCLLLLSRKLRCSDTGFLAGFLCFSFLAICPGLYFRSHYFVMLLPAAALMAGAAAGSVRHLTASGSLPLRRFLPALLLLAAAGYCLFMEKEYFFTLTPVEVSRFTYDDNPFPESLQIARYLKDHTSPGDRIAVLGSEPQIYFYADRVSASGHIYMYGLMEDQPHAGKMQLQMIREIEESRPKYVVLVNVKQSWLPGLAPQSPVMEWHKRFLQGGYDLVGVTDIVDSSTTRYLWDKEVTGYTPVSGAFLTIFKRKDGA